MQSIGAIFDDGVDASLETDSHDFAMQYWNFDSPRFEHSGLLQTPRFMEKNGFKRVPKADPKNEDNTCAQTGFSNAQSELSAKLLLRCMLPFLSLSAMAQHAHPRICDLCGGVYGDEGCTTSCPRRRGMRRRDVRRILDLGHVVHGLVPTSQLLVEANYRLAIREEALRHRVAELDERMREAADTLRWAQADLDEARRIQLVLLGFQQRGSPSPQMGQPSGQPESEPSVHGGS